MCCRPTRKAAMIRRTADSSLLPRLECAAEFVGKRSEPLRRCGILALGVGAHFIGLVRVEDRLGAEANATAWRVVHFEDDDLDVGADGKRSRDVRFLDHAGLAHRNETGA